MRRHALGAKGLCALLATTAIISLTATAQARGVRSASVPQQGVSVPVRTTVQRQVDVKLGASAIYDSNASQSNSFRTTSTNLSKEDVSFPVGANLNIQIPSGRNRYSLSGFIGYEFNLKNTNLDSEDIGLDAGYSRDIHPCTVSLSGGFRRARTQFGNAGFLQLIKNIETTTSIGSTVNCGGATGIQPFVSANYSVGRNSLINREVSDYDLVTYGAGIVLASPSIGNLGIVGSINDTTYPNRTSNGTVGSRKVKAKNIGFYFNRSTARILQATVQLNYTSVDDGSLSGGFDGLSGNASVRFMPGGRFSFSGTFARAALPSLSFNSDYNLETNWNLAVNAAVTPKIGAQIGYSNRSRTYFGQINDPVHPLTDDTIRSATASADYTMNSRIGWRLAVTYEQRRANDRFYDYSGVRASVGVDVSL